MIEEVTLEHAATRQQFLNGRASRWRYWHWAVLTLLIVVFLVYGLCWIVFSIATAQRLDVVLYTPWIPLDRSEAERRLYDFSIDVIALDDIPTQYRRHPTPAPWEHDTKVVVRYTHWGQSVIICYDESDRVTTVIAEYE